MEKSSKKIMAIAAGITIAAVLGGLFAPEKGKKLAKKWAESLNRKCSREKLEMIKGKLEKHKACLERHLQKIDTKLEEFETRS